MLQISVHRVMSLVRIIFSKRQWGWQQWWEELPVHRVQGSTWHYIGRSPEQVKYDLIQSYIICGDQFGMFMIFIMDKCQGDDGFYLIKIDHDFRNMMRYPIWLSEAEGFINRLQCCSVRCKPGKYVYYDNCDWWHVVNDIFLLQLNYGWWKWQQRGWQSSWLPLWWLSWWWLWRSWKIHRGNMVGSTGHPFSSMIGKVDLESLAIATQFLKMKAMRCHIGSIPDQTIKVDYMSFGQFLLCFWVGGP